MSIPLVGSNITRKSLEFTNRSLDVVNMSLDLTNKPLNHYFGPLLYTKVCLPLANLRRTPQLLICTCLSTNIYCH